MNNKKILLVSIILISGFLIIGCVKQQENSLNNGLNNVNKNQIKNNNGGLKNQLVQGEEEKIVDRLESIPSDAIKVFPENDEFPPILHSSEWFEPIPLPFPVNTAGAEDSAFILPDGKTLYFFFTPSVKVPPEKQLIDGVTGIYVSKKINEKDWSEPKRIVLSEGVALDGCPFVLKNRLWFCSVRKGNFRDVDVWIAELENNEWKNWRNAGEKLNKDFEVGELHITSDGKKLFFHSNRSGGIGGYDIWVSRNENGEWLEPENVKEVNSIENDGWPFISHDGKELWFTRTLNGAPAIYRSKRVNGKWSEPELIVSQFASEPSLDSEGNLYFVHHFFKNGEMIESDIYVAIKK
jgi:hypothetical protein